MQTMPKCHDCGKFCHPVEWKIIYSGALQRTGRRKLFESAEPQRAIFSRSTPGSFAFMMPNAELCGARSASERTPG